MARGGIGSVEPPVGERQVEGRQAESSSKAARTKAPDDWPDANVVDRSIDIYSVEIAELRAELRSRGGDAIGLKKVVAAG